MKFSLIEYKQMGKTINYFLVIFFVILIFGCRKTNHYVPSMSVDKIELPEPITINSIKFLNNNKGFLAGGITHTIGSIYRTDNGGLKWYKVFGSDSLSVNDIFFLNDTIGYACGDSLMLLKTIDGGSNWEIQEYDNLPNYNDIVSFTQVFAIDTSSIFLIGNDGINKGLFSKKNNGEWIHTYFTVKTYSFLKITEYVFAFGADNMIVFTEDGANTFDDVLFSGQSFRSMGLTAFNDIFALSTRGILYYSNDLGFNWHIALHKTKYAYTNMHFRHGLSVICGLDGVVFVSYDSPYEWFKVEQTPRNNFYSVFVKNNKEIFIGSDDGNLFLLNQRRPV